MSDVLQQILAYAAIILGVCILIGLVGCLALVRRIRRLGIPRNADFWTTMRLAPLPLVVCLDLLDFGLDIFSAPIVWVLLDRMGLPNLRNKAALEALIPVTGVIPTFTLAWIVARALDLGLARPGRPWRAAPPDRQRLPARGRPFGDTRHD